MRPDHVYRSSENLSQPEPRCLVLLTHQFPHDFGDAAFVRNEIEALADEFDQVRIVSFWSGDEPALPIPDNCSYLGSVGRVTLRRVLRSALSWTRLRTFMHTLIRAARAREFHARDDVRAALVGMVIAHRLTELGARKSRNEALTIYSFWGVDIAYALPWFANVHDTVAVRVHRYDLDEESEGYRPLRRAVLGTADALLTISESAQRYLRDRYPFIPADRVLVRRLGVTGPDEVSLARKAPPSETLVSCSSMIPRKRVGLILAVAAEVARRGRPVTWIHFGDGPEFEEVRSLAERLSAEIPHFRVHLPGRMPHESILQYHRSTPAALFVNLSTDEGVPVSAMEAAAHGIPIVATDVGATRELVGVEVGSGILVEPGASVHTVADAVEEVLASPDCFHPRRIWSERFDGHRNASATAMTIAQISPRRALFPHRNA